MTQDSNESELQRRMAPGALCLEGFLGTDPRAAAEILAADRAALDAMGLTHRDLAEPLRTVLDLAMTACGRAVRLGRATLRPDPAGDLSATCREAMGRIVCPFDDGLFPKGEVELLDGRTGECLTVTPLSVHLIAEHGFYQGRPSRYRLEPRDIARMFGLGPPER